MTASPTITNNAVFDLQTDASISGAGTFINSASGTFKKSAGTSDTGGGFQNNSGAFAFQNAGTVQSLSGALEFQNGFTQTAGSTSVASGARIDTNPGMAINGGTVSGFGSVNGSITNAATFTPGSPAGGSPGILTINGSYTQTSTGTLHIELDSAGSYDTLAVSGTATLAGTLNVTSVGGFSPAATNSFAIMAFQSKTGDFTTNNLTVGGVTFTKVYTPTLLTLAVPGDQGTVSLSQTPVNFGSVQVGTNTSASPQTLKISNSGPGDVTIVQLNPIGDQNDFQQVTPLIAGDCNTQSPTLISAGSSCNLRAYFGPLVLGARSLQVVMTLSNATAGSQSTFVLNGTGIAGAPASITVTGGNGQSSAVSTQFAAPLQATVFDSLGNRVGGATVTFSAPGSGSSVTFAGGVKTSVTDAGGVATSTAITANSAAGSYTVTASVTGVGTSASFGLNNIAGSNNIITVAGGGTGGLPVPSMNICLPSYFGGIFGGNYYVKSCSQIFKVTPGGSWALVAGTGVPGFSGDGGPAVSAEINNLNALFVDGAGNVFISDAGNQRVREVVAATGIIQTIAGTGTGGYNGDNIPPAAAQLSNPNGLFVDSTGDIFIADSGNNRIREISGGLIYTVAGTGTSGYNGDSNATTSNLTSPQGVFVDSSGNIFIADTNANRVREVIGSSISCSPCGSIQTIAGTGVAGYNGDRIPALSAEVGSPTSVFVDSSSNIFIADTNNHRIRKITGGTITTVAGNGNFGFTGDGALATSARIATPGSVFVDNPTGNIFFASVSGVREVVASSSNIQTVAGNSALGYFGDGSSATSAQLFDLFGLAVDNAGNFYVADGGKCPHPGSFRGHRSDSNDRRNWHSRVRR